jgi:hypothetical protein
MKSLLLNLLKSPSKRERRKANPLMKAKDPSVASHNTHPWQCPGKKILAKIATTDLKEAGIKPPKAPSQEKKGTDKTKNCWFHKFHRHLTDDCIHLKDAIEILIQ